MHVHPLLRVGLITTALIAAGMPALAQDDGDADATPATTLLDLSGLASIAPGQVIAVHDAKTPDEDDRPRVSMLTLTGTPQGVTWEEVNLEWPEEGGPSNDLESATSIPGRLALIFAESGDDGGDFQRLFFVEFESTAVGSLSASIIDVVTWPQPAYNIESLAAAEAGGETILLYAERAQGQPTTQINWAPITLSPLELGTPASVEFDSPAVQGPGDRPISAMEVGPDGTIYVASAFDSGSDNGPYSAAIFAAGWVTAGPNGPEVVIDPEPELLATVDGFKVESLAFVEALDGTTSLYLGTDDENFGGVLRPVPLD